MNFRLESYDTRYSGWMACTLFADDFTACWTVGEAQGLLDRVSAAYMAHTFRVRYESVLTPCVNAPDRQTLKEYKLEFWSTGYKAWAESMSLRGVLAKCKNDVEAEKHLAEIKKNFSRVDYRIRVIEENSSYLIE